MSILPNYNIGDALRKSGRTITRSGRGGGRGVLPLSKKFVKEQVDMIGKRAMAQWSAERFDISGTTGYGYGLGTSGGNFANSVNHIRGVQGLPVGGHAIRYGSEFESEDIARFRKLYEPDHKTLDMSQICKPISVMSAPVTNDEKAHWCGESACNVFVKILAIVWGDLDEPVNESVKKAIEDNLEISLESPQAFYDSFVKACYDDSMTPRELFEDDCKTLLDPPGANATGVTDIPVTTSGKSQKKGPSQKA